MTAPTLGLDARLRIRRGDFTLDLELAIEPGRTAALLGPNGAGKTTTVEGLAGLVPLDDGHIRLGGRSLDEPAAEIFVPPDSRRWKNVCSSTSFASASWTM